jgi:RNA polymerase sigma-70 factor, ECF subfamily
MSRVQSVEQFLTVGENPLARYRDYLRALARTWLGSRPSSEVDASDIVQEALLKAHRSCEQFRGQSERELAAWLRTILNHTLANALRSRSRQKLTGSECLTIGPDDSSVCAEWLPEDKQLPPQDVASLNEQLLCLARALSQLPEDQRCVVELKHLHDFSIAEICERTGRSKPSVVGLLYRGMKALRVLMDVPEQEEGNCRPDDD